MVSPNCLHGKNLKMVREKSKIVQRKTAMDATKARKKKNLWQNGGVKDIKGDRLKLGMFKGVGSNGPTNEKPSISTVKKCPVH